MDESENSERGPDQKEDACPASDLRPEVGPFVQNPDRPQVDLKMGLTTLRRRDGLSGSGGPVSTHLLMSSRAMNTVNRPDRPILDPSTPPRPPPPTFLPLPLPLPMRA